MDFILVGIVFIVMLDMLDLQQNLLYIMVIHPSHGDTPGSSHATVEMCYMWHSAITVWTTIWERQDIPNNGYQSTHPTYGIPITVTVKRL